MAQQKGIIKASGTLGGITFFQLHGKYYLRKKTSLNKERILKDPAYALFRLHASLHGTSASIAKPLYWLLPQNKRKHHVFGKLTAFVKALLKQGKTLHDIITAFKKEYLGITEIKEKAGMIRKAILLKDKLQSQPF